MRQLFNFLVFGLAIAVLLPSCVSKKKFDELLEEKGQLAESLAQTQEKVKMLEEEMAEMEATYAADKEKLNGEIASLKSDLAASADKAAKAEAMAKEKEAEISKLKADVKEALGAGGLDVKSHDGNLLVVTSSPVTYRSGSTRISKEGKGALETLAEVLKNNPDVHLLVEGHADDQKLKEGAPWNDNWDLSLDRSMKVVRKLIKMGVDPGQLAAVGRGEYDPKADGDTKEARAENRRTEFTPVGKNGKIYDKVNN